MKHTIKRGETVLGTITCPDGAFGMEVLVDVAPDFRHADPEGDNQFDSRESAERFLNQVYERSCELRGVTPEPQNAPAAEWANYPLDDAAEAEAAYYATLEEQASEGDDYGLDGDPDFHD